MKTEILKIKGDWQEVVDDCRATVGKESLGKEPSRSIQQRIRLAEHSPVRAISAQRMWPEIKSWIAIPRRCGNIHRRGQCPGPHRHHAKAAVLPGVTGDPGLRRGSEGGYPGAGA